MRSLRVIERFDERPFCVQKMRRAKEVARSFRRAPERAATRRALRNPHVFQRERGKEKMIPRVLADLR